MPGRRSAIGAAAFVWIAALNERREALDALRRAVFPGRLAAERREEACSAF